MESANEELELKLAYDGPLAVPEKKVQDSIMLCEDLAIPKRYHAFYYGLKKKHEDEHDLDSGSSDEEESENDS